MFADILCIVFIVFFLARGFFRGFFTEALALAGMIVAGFFAFTLYRALGGFAFGIIERWPSLMNGLAFALIFFLIWGVFLGTARLLSNAAKKLKLSGLNRLAGAGFGAAKGAVFAGLLLFAAHAVLSQVGHGDVIEESEMARPVMEFTERVLGAVGNALSGYKEA